MMEEWRLPNNTGRCQNLKQIDEKIQQLEVELNNWQKYRSNLTRVADKIKWDVQSCSRQLIDSVQKRQTQLLRQTDYFHGYQLSRVDLKLAQMHQDIGSLKSLRQAYQVFTPYLPEPSCPSMDKTSLPSDIRVNLDTTPLQSQIQSFGHIGMDGIMSSVENGYFPESEEEYTEASLDHHVMVKPLGAPKPKFFLPQLGEMDKWLAGKREVTYNGAPEVGQWLQHIKNETCPEPPLDDCDWNEFEVIEKGGSSIGSDGIETLSNTSSPVRQDCSKAQDPRSIWLLTCSQKENPSSQGNNSQLEPWLPVSSAANSTSPPSSSLTSRDVQHIRHIFSHPRDNWIAPKTGLPAQNQSQMSFHMQKFCAMQNGYDWVLKSPVAA